MFSQPLILASASPRRRELLTALGWPFEVHPAVVSEEERPGESPEELVQRLSLLKAQTLKQQFPDRIIIGSDTVVVLKGQILGKPRHNAEALSMLSRLSGQSHEVFSGLAVVSPGKTLVGFDRCVVHIRSLSDADIAAYEATGESADKAGAYAIQGLGTLLVDAIEGNYTTVVGLPVPLLSRFMVRLGLALSDQWSDLK